MGSWVNEQISVYLQFGARAEWEEPIVWYGVVLEELSRSPGSVVSRKSECLSFLPYKSDVITLTPPNPQLREDYRRRDCERTLRSDNPVQMPAIKILAQTLELKYLISNDLRTEKMSPKHDRK